MFKFVFTDFQLTDAVASGITIINYFYMTDNT